MSVSSTAVKIQYTGDGSTTNFSFPFNLLTDLNAGVVISPTDVTIYFGAAGSEVVQSSSNYTVNGPYGSPANTIIFNSAPTNGTLITIERVKALTQGSRFIDGQPFPASTFELALDRLTMEVQQLQEQLTRAPLLYPATKLGQVQVQDLVANNFLGVDATGTKVVMVGQPNGSGTGFPPTGNLPMGSNKFTGLAAGTSSGDSLAYAQAAASLASLTVTGATASNSLSLAVPLPVASGGSGSASPALVAGSNVTITGSWPNQTINSTATTSRLDYQSGNPLANVVNTTVATTVYTYTLPANTLGATGAIEIIAVGDYLNNSGGAVNETVTINFGSAALSPLSVTTINNASNASRGPLMIRALITNNGATNVNSVSARLLAPVTPAGVAGSGLQTDGTWDSQISAAAIDTTSNQTISIVVTHATASANVSTRIFSVLTRQI